MEIYCWSTPNAVYMQTALCDELQEPIPVRVCIRMGRIDSQFEYSGKTETLSVVLPTQISRPMINHKNIFK
jgi:hypothetical protein